jgi:hypothetical protein
MSDPLASSLATSLTVDPPATQTAAIRTDKTDRRKIDNQILACEQHLVDSVLSGATCTWCLLSSNSAALNPGDCFCTSSENSPSGIPIVTKAVSAALANAGTVLGVATGSASPGARFRGAIGGALPGTLTGLASGAPGVVRCNTTTARAQLVTGLLSTDYPVGTVDNTGQLSIVRLNTGLLSTVGGNLQWVTALDLDWTAQGSQTINADGNWTIAGKTWVKDNSAHDSAAMQLTNGTGLIITPDGPSNLSAATYTAPTFRVPLTTYIPTLSPNMPLRIWNWISTSNEAANFDEAFFGLMIPNGGFANQYNVASFRGFTGGVNGWGSQIIVLQSNVTVTGTSIPFTGNRVGMMSFPAGIFGGTSSMYTGTTVAGGVWPAVGSMFITTAPALSSAASAALASSGSGQRNANDINLFLSALRAGSGTAFAATFARTRIDYLPIAM